MASTDLDANQPPTVASGDAGTEPRSTSRRRRRRGGGGGANASDASQTSAPPAPQRPPEQRQRPTGDQNRRKSEGKSLTPRPWRDGRQRVVCAQLRAGFPLVTPVVHRTGLATRPLVEIARNGAISLVCDQVHPGPCVWPGEAVGGDQMMHLVVIAPGQPAPEVVDWNDDHGDDGADTGEDNLADE